MDWRAMAKENEGLHTVESFSKMNGIMRETAINYLHGLRKAGFAETERGSGGKRLYSISPLRLKKIGYPGLYETLNSYSSVKLVLPFEERTDHEIKPEEAVVRAILTRDFRAVLASLSSFRKIKDWWSLYRLSKEHGVERFVGALYFLSRKLFGVASIDRRVLRMLKSSSVKERYIIPGMKSQEFGVIEREWGVFIPFNASDLERLRGG